MKNRRPAEAGRRFDVSADYRSDVDGELVEPFVDGAVEPPELPEPLEPPMFGQSPGEPEWVRGAVPPVLPLPSQHAEGYGPQEQNSCPGLFSFGFFSRPERPEHPECA